MTSVFLIFVDKDEKLQVLSHITVTFLVLVGHERTHTTVKKSGGHSVEDVDPSDVTNLSWAG